MTDPFFKGSTGRNTRGLLRLTILSLIAGAAIASRLFSVIRKYNLALQSFYTKDKSSREIGIEAGAPLTL